MNFWVRNLIFLTVLLAIAYALLVNQDAIDELNNTFFPESDQVATEVTEGEEQQSKTSPNDKEVIEPPQRSKKKLSRSRNAAADGLSRFYANLHGVDDDDGPKIRDNVVFLPQPKGDLEKILTAKAMITRPLKTNWRGQTESRPFRKGSTLLQKLIEYAEQDGLEVIWRLDKDFLIKDPFRIEKEILQTAYQIGKAVEGHFPDGMEIYFCNKQRSIVFIEGTSEYLAKECKTLSSSMPKQNRRYN